MKAAFRRPEIGDLKHELSTLDISTNKYVHTTSYTIPLNEKAYHPTLGLTGFLLWRQYWRHFWGSFFYGGISPSKIGLIAPY
jgi:hypothetical protein